MRSARPFSLMRCCSCLSCHLSCRLHQPRRSCPPLAPMDQLCSQWLSTLHDKGRSSRETLLWANFEICNDIFTTPREQGCGNDDRGDDGRA